MRKGKKMQAVLKMIRFLYLMTIRVIVIYLVFMALAWLLLGMPIMETWNVSMGRINTFFGKVTGFADDTADAAKGLSQLGEKHLNEAKDRFHGVDPYEGYNKRLSDDMNQKGQN